MNPYYIKYPLKKFQSPEDVEAYMLLVSTFFNNPPGFKPYPNMKLSNHWVVDNANDWICKINQTNPNIVTVSFSYRYSNRMDIIDSITKWVAFRTGGVFHDIANLEDIDFA